MSQTVLHVPLLVVSTLYVRTEGSGSKVSLLSKIARSVLRVHKELLRDVRNVITGSLKNNCMKLTTGSGDNVSRISARRAWIPLKEGKNEIDDARDHCRLYQYNRAHQVWIDQSGPKEERGLAV